MLPKHLLLALILLLSVFTTYARVDADNDDDDNDKDCDKDCDKDGKDDNDDNDDEDENPEIAFSIIETIDDEETHEITLELEDKASSLKKLVAKLNAYDDEI